MIFHLPVRHFIRSVRHHARSLAACLKRAHIGNRENPAAAPRRPFTPVSHNLSSSLSITYPKSISDSTPSPCY
jgi:hypothetical protein